MGRKTKTIVSPKSQSENLNPSSVLVLPPHKRGETIFRFSGHQTFPLRIAWIPKAVGQIVLGCDPLTNIDEGIAKLGLGKNMVEALRCWIEAFQIATRVDGSWSLTPIGKLIFHPKEGLDPYLEDVSSSWILHWLICTNNDSPFSAWECVFNRWPATEFSASQIIEVFEKEAQLTPRPASVVTLRQHWEVFLHSYLPTRAAKGEDHLDSAMSALRLIRKFGERPNAENAGARNSPACNGDGLAPASRIPDCGVYELASTAPTSVQRWAYRFKSRLLGPKLHLNEMPHHDKTRRPTTMGALLRIHPRYMRSVHLERDFSDSSSSLGYVLTPVAAGALSRICEGFHSTSTQRAFRIAGDYGSGKSAFGLALARIAAGNTQALPKGLRSFCGRNRVRPLLATGDHEPLGVTVLRALGIKVPPGSKPSTAEVLTKASNAIGRAKTKGFRGVLLVLGELGKNLEFAAQHPESDDIFLLQRLAEVAARSGDQPLVIVVMLHQGVAAYASGLDTTARREWDKVAGRFEEIVYGQPLEQIVTLVAATLNVQIEELRRSVAEEARKSMIAAIRNGIYGSLVAPSLGHLGPKIFPFHPTVLPVLVRVIRKFGQNERSLFSFISASEPMGLQQHIQSDRSQFEPYRIHHLFEYVRQNLMPGITTGNSYIHWGFVDSLLMSTPLKSVEEEHAFKTVALLTLLDSPDLPATEEFLHLALDNGSNHGAVSRAIKELKGRSILYERGTARGLCVWSHTSVNLDDAFERGAAATRTTGDTVELLCKHLPLEQIVPRGHYFRSGTLRYGEVQFLPATALPQLLSSQVNPREDSLAMAAMTRHGISDSDASRKRRDELNAALRVYNQAHVCCLAALCSIYRRSVRLREYPYWSRYAVARHRRRLAAANWHQQARLAANLP